MILFSASFINAYTQADGFGKLIFWSLFFLSILSWVVLINKIWFTRQIRFYCHEFDKHLGKNNVLNFSIEDMQNYPYFKIHKTLKEKTLEVLEKNRFFHKNGEKNVYLSLADMQLIESQVDLVIAHQIKLLEKNLFILSTVVTLAPFLGLLGTVWGILITFSQLQVPSMVSANSVVLSGLAMALATTVVGLIVAIPALIAYNYLKNVIRGLSQDMEDFARRLITSVEMQYRRVDD